MDILREVHAAMKRHDLMHGAIWDYTDRAGLRRVAKSQGIPFSRFTSRRTLLARITLDELAKERAKQLNAPKVKRHDTYANT